MDRTVAEALIRQYFQSWLEQDIDLFLSTMTEDVHVIECYGPVYSGVEEVQQWFANWHDGDGNGKVTRWEIVHILYDERLHMAAIEWDFECIYEDNQAGFPGASLFHFRDGKISSIQEYQMERNQYRPFGD